MKSDHEFSSSSISILRNASSEIYRELSFTGLSISRKKLKINNLCYLADAVGNGLFNKYWLDAITQLVFSKTTCS